jgi:adenylate cyclase class 2
VPTETEIKIKIEDCGDFCRRLKDLNADILSARHFEDNLLLDFADQRLSSGQCLLRIRFAEDSGLLTYKGPPRPEGIFKTREELEIRLENGAAMLQILERIGMRVCFRYQKYRQEFALDGIEVAVEFEGSQKGIGNLARKMGIAESRFLRSSYYALYAEDCRQRGRTPQFMIF